MHLLLVITLNVGTKFRTLSKEMAVREAFFEGVKQAPSQDTIANWVKKVGYYELQKPKEKRDDWIILLDHSIQLGSEKIFVVLGILERDFLTLNRPLSYTDMQPLCIKTASQWNGKLVCLELQAIARQIGQIKYAVGDYGSDLKKGLELLGIPHIHDLSHAISLEIKRMYSKDERFLSLKKRMAQMRKQFLQTDIAAIIPPSSRKKSAYQNLDSLVKWGNEAFALVNSRLTSKRSSIIKKGISKSRLQRIAQELLWINEYKELLEELREVNNVVKKIEKSIKHQGLHLSLLGSLQADFQNLKSVKGELLAKNMLSKLSEQLDLLPNTSIVLASSDILESIFGRYKNRLSENPMASPTSLMLIIAAFTVDLTAEKVIASIENVKIVDLKKWAKQQSENSLIEQRKLLLSA